MSENIPFEVQEDIIGRLPVRSLLRFRSVSRTWKSLIDSSDFIDRYNAQHTGMQHLLVTHYDPVDFEQKYVSIADDDTFPQQKVSLPVPRFVKNGRIIGCSHGLLCLYGDCREVRGHNSRMVMAVLWNLSIRKAVAVIVPNVGDGIYTTTLGFGVCRETTDPKIVKITYFCRCYNVEHINSIPWQVEIFALSTGAWRNPYSNRPRNSIQFCCSQVVIDGFLYWLATDRIAMNGGPRSCNLIISFDLTTEEFTEVNLPDNLAHQSYMNLSMCKLRESLVVLERDADANNPVFVVWMMEDGVPKLFTTLFTVNVNPLNASVMGFRKSGAPIVELRGLLVVYEPYLLHGDDFLIHGVTFTFHVCPYVESLLLFDQPDLVVYNDT